MTGMTTPAVVPTLVLPTIRNQSSGPVLAVELPSSSESRVRPSTGADLARTIKPLKVANLRDRHSGRDERDTSQGLQRLNDRGQRLLRHQLADGLL